ncbi:Gfo/Idh/MocA family oxidoreductase [Microbacterium trichothecenolyticum]|uniref:Gfo/Idh/MocA family oxidoreductase n=1 Tax=Microbacterium trichothecenolyticum TaxID=69370 RepID=UPI0035BEA14D
MSEALRAAIIGTGFMGTVHAQAVRATGNEVVGFVGTSAESAQAVADRFPGAAAATSLAQMLRHGVDVVHICAPNDVHAIYAEEAINAGLHVICEKPLATSVDDATRLTRDARARDLVTGVPFVYWFYPMVREIRSRVEANADDRLWLLHGSYLQDWLADPAASNWRVDPKRGGASRTFGDIGVHWCDLMEFVTGQRITRLTARTANAFQRHGGETANLTEDGAVVLFETDQGALGSLVVSQASAGRRNRLWFSFDGPGSAYSFDQEHPEQAWIGGPAQSTVVDRAPVPGSSTTRPFALPAGHPQGYQHCFNDFVADTYSAIRGAARAGRPEFVDGLRAAIITSAVMESVETQSWVDVPTLDDTLSHTRSLAAQR